MNVDQVETPAVIVDLDVLEANIRDLQAYLNRYGIKNRPHIKTHKVPEIAQMQLAAGAVGITCQKLGEAEVMCDSGIRDIFVTYNIIGDAKLQRLAGLAQRSEIKVSADSRVVVDGLSKAAREFGFSLRVLVEFDTGLGRCGVQSPAEAVELGERIARSPGLQFGGLMTYPLNQHTAGFIEDTARRLTDAALPLETVSVGGTHVIRQAHLYPWITEYRAGMYAYGDRLTVKSGAVPLERCALKVLSTVVSRPTAERAILDAGSKSLGTDLLGLDGYGLILEYPDIRLPALSEEHGHCVLTAPSHRPEIGERVSVLPNHCCLVSNLFDRVYGVRGGVVEKEFKVAARGKVV
jgi:D-serine deaminase-like pyridoxal phosphate-dependent protein